MAAESARGTEAGNGGLPVVRARHSSGALLEVYLWGATVTSFKTPSGQEVLFVSSEAVFDGAKPIRGGIPVVFPQFGTQGPLPQHGFARNSVWTLDRVDDGAVELSLSDSEATRAVWPHAFHLHYRINFDGEQLTTQLQVTNPKDSGAPFPFEALLHTYLAVGRDNIGSVRVGGLRGLAYISKPEGGARKVQAEEALAIDREVDRVYLKAPDAVTVTGIAAAPPAAGAAPGAAGGAGGRRVTGVTCKSHATLRDAAPGLRQVVVKCPLDVVVWNPWIERAKAIADLGDEDYKHYVCVEPGKVSTDAAAFEAHAALAPGKMWSLIQQLQLNFE